DSIHKVSSRHHRARSRQRSWRQFLFRSLLVSNRTSRSISHLAFRGRAPAPCLSSIVSSVEDPGSGWFPVSPLSGGMLQSRLLMFCPKCGAEYLPHVRRCSDCDVPLVERLAISRGDSGRKRVSGFVLFKELGVFIVIPVVFLAATFVFIALRDNPFEVQIASMIGYTGSVFFFVFCDAGPGKALRG